jgi:hypothetical protein
VPLANVWAQRQSHCVESALRSPFPIPSYIIPSYNALYAHFILDAAACDSIVNVFGRALRSSFISFISTLGRVKVIMMFLWCLALT